MQGVMGQSSSFYHHFEKSNQDISFQAIPLSLAVPIHVLKGIPARGPVYSMGWSDLPGPTSSAWILETLASLDRYAEATQSFLKFREMSCLFRGENPSLIWEPGPLLLKSRFQLVSPILGRGISCWNFHAVNARACFFETLIIQN